MLLREHCNVVNLLSFAGKFSTKSPATGSPRSIMPKFEAIWRLFIDGNSYASECANTSVQTPGKFRRSDTSVFVTSGAHFTPTSILGPVTHFKVNGSAGHKRIVL